MGLLQSKKNKLIPHDALMLGILSVSSIDGNISDDEIDIMVRLGENGESNLNVDELLELYDNNSLESCVEMVTEALNDKQKLTVFSNLLDVAMSDGVLDQDEALLINAYKDAFEMDSSDVNTIAEVISIKNKSL